LAPSALPAAYAAYASVGPQSPPRIWVVLISRQGQAHGAWGSWVRRLECGV